MRGIAISRRVLLAGAAGAVVLALAAGCGDDNSGDMPGMGHGSGATATSAERDPGAGFNDADVTFAQNMIPHHKQAVQMADLAASRASDPEIKQLAGQIKAAQDPEIKTLTGWLTAWGRPVEPPQGHGGHAMPGMMSDAEMGKLTGATGKDFDRMFAQMMIAHHNGAIQMAKDEQAGGANPDAKALAATIERTQADEVGKLEKILDRL
jgi:uncharacterized protein (DUF305 family)